MIKHSKTWLALVAATVMLGALVGNASARNLSTSNQTLRATFNPITLAAGSTSVRCQVTLEGSLHSRTIAKVLNSLIGYITRAELTGCVGGTATILTATLPWHVTYQGFNGTLPNITALRTTVVRPGFRVTAPFFGIPITCTYRTSNVNGIFNREVGGALTTVVVEGRNLAADEGGCPAGELSGTSNSLTVLNSATRITVTLI